MTEQQFGNIVETIRELAKEPADIENLRWVLRMMLQNMLDSETSLENRVNRLSEATGEQLAEIRSRLDNLERAERNRQGFMGFPGD